MEPDEADSDGPKILVVGFNKCGTRSLHELFQRSGIPSVHWRDEQERNIAERMLTNASIDAPPLAGFGGFRAFSDLTFVSNRLVIEGARLFRQLHLAYPDSYFVLNTRPIEAWIESRRRHARGRFVNRSMMATGLTRPELEARWRSMWHRHLGEVRDHFFGHDRFVEFDIAADDPLKLADAVSADFCIDPSHWGWYGKTYDAQDTMDNRAPPTVVSVSVST